MQLQNSGVVTAVLVEDGQKVTAGTPLAEISSQRFGQQQVELSGTLLIHAQQILDNLHSEKEQLLKQQQLAVQRTAGDVANLKEQLKVFVAQAKMLANRIQLNEVQLARLQSLSGSGYISELELNRQKDQLFVSVTTTTPCSMAVVINTEAA